MTPCAFVQIKYTRCLLNPRTGKWIETTFYAMHMVRVADWNDLDERADWLREQGESVGVNVWHCEPTPEYTGKIYLKGA